jgi:hypothetical protein
MLFATLLPWTHDKALLLFMELEMYHLPCAATHERARPRWLWADKVHAFIKSTQLPKAIVESSEGPVGNLPAAR